MELQGEKVGHLGRCFPKCPTGYVSMSRVLQRLIESMMGLRLRQENLRLVFRLFSLM